MWRGSTLKKTKKEQKTRLPLASNPAKTPRYTRPKTTPNPPGFSATPTPKKSPNTLILLKQSSKTAKKPVADFPAVSKNKIQIYNQPMKYGKILQGTFINRPNRFIAEVEINGKTEKIHVKNTGRCRELLIKGASVYLEQSKNPKRKTLFDLIAVEKTQKENSIKKNYKPGTVFPLLINMDSQAPNKIAGEWIKESGYFNRIKYLKPEYTLGKSRFDFYLEYLDKDGQEHKMIIEVKGVTLEKNGIAMFPDATTERGLKHIKELTRLCKTYETAVIFVIQMKGPKIFMPNYETHREFALSLKEAFEQGVKLIAFDTKVTPDKVLFDTPVKIHLEGIK